MDRQIDVRVDSSNLASITVEAVDTPMKLDVFARRMAAAYQSRDQMWFRRGIAAAKYAWVNVAKIRPDIAWALGQFPTVVEEIRKYAERAQDPVVKQIVIACQQSGAVSLEEQARNIQEIEAVTDRTRQAHNTAQIAHGLEVRAIETAVTAAKMQASSYQADLESLRLQMRRKEAESAATIRDLLDQLQTHKKARVSELQAQVDTLADQVDELTPWKEFGLEVCKKFGAHPSMKPNVRYALKEVDKALQEIKKETVEQETMGMKLANEQSREILMGEINRLKAEVKRLDSIANSGARATPEEQLAGNLRREDMTPERKERIREMARQTKNAPAIELEDVIVGDPNSAFAGMKRNTEGPERGSESVYGKPLYSLQGFMNDALVRHMEALMEARGIEMRNRQPLIEYMRSKLQVVLTDALFDVCFFIESNESLDYLVATWRTAGSALDSMWTGSEHILKERMERAQQMSATA